MAVEGVPADSKKHLEPDESESVFGADDGGLLEWTAYMSGSHSPVADAYRWVEDLDSAAGMSFGVAGVTQRDGFTSVVLVHDGSMGEDVVFVAVEFPEAEHDMVEVDDVVTFEFVFAAAAVAGSGFVAANPIGVYDRGSDFLFDFPYWTVCSHEDIIHHRDLHLEKMGFALTGISRGRRVQRASRGSREGIDIIGE